METANVHSRMKSSKKDAVSSSHSHGVPKPSKTFWVYPNMGHDSSVFHIFLLETVGLSKWMSLLENLRAKYHFLYLFSVLLVKICYDPTSLPTPKIKTSSGK